MIRINAYAKIHSLATVCKLFVWEGDFASAEEKKRANSLAQEIKAFRGHIAYSLSPIALVGGYYIPPCNDACVLGGKPELVTILQSDEIKEDRAVNEPDAISHGNRVHDQASVDYVDFCKVLPHSEACCG